MITAELVEQFERMTNKERLTVIEAATRLIRRGLAGEATSSSADEEDRLRAAALAARDLYDPGSDHTEWTVLDAEDVLDDSVPR